MMFDHGYPVPLPIIAGHVKCVRSIIIKLRSVWFPMFIDTILVLYPIVAFSFSFIHFLNKHIKTNPFSDSFSMNHQAYDN